MIYNSAKIALDFITCIAMIFASLPLLLNFFYPPSLNWFGGETGKLISEHNFQDPMFIVGYLLGIAFLFLSAAIIKYVILFVCGVLDFIWIKVRG